MRTAAATSVSGPTATFRLPSGQDLLLTVALHQTESSPLAADIAFRFLQRLSMATAERLERLLVARPDESLAEAAQSIESTSSPGRYGREPATSEPVPRRALCIAPNERPIRRRRGTSGNVSSAPGTA